MLSKDQLENVKLAEEYIHQVSTIEGLPEDQLKKNRMMNDKIYIRSPWSVEKLFKEYLEHFKEPIQLTRHIQGPIRQAKQFQTITEHFKDCTFKPKISSMSKEIEKNKRFEAKQKASELCESSNLENPFQTEQQSTYLFLII